MKIAPTMTIAPTIAPTVRNPPNESIVSRHRGFGFGPGLETRGDTPGEDCLAGVVSAAWRRVGEVVVSAQGLPVVMARRLSGAY